LYAAADRAMYAGKPSAAEPDTDGAAPA
jgi:hypothetical protein